MLEVFMKLYTKISKSKFSTILHKSIDRRTVPKACCVLSIALLVNLCLSQDLLDMSDILSHILLWHLYFVIQTLDTNRGTISFLSVDFCSKEESQYILQTKELTYNITIGYCVFSQDFLVEVSVDQGSLSG